MAAVISSELVKNLREQSGAPMMDCKRALEEARGDFSAAARILKERGLAKAEKKATRTTKEGLITSYVHNGRVGVLVEIGCETDFVARCTDLQNLGKELTLQVASMAPRYVSREQVPAEEVAKIRKAFKQEDTPAEKRLEEWFAQFCLLDQASIRDPGQRIKDLVAAAIAKIGENIVIKRFVRFELGEM
ncbi:MAG: translation elongation factor Ts [Candidatus Omnitrophica bacterium]|nr:translation elongation factor Ts [Candidatus Omnitrophota bacterium]